MSRKMDSEFLPNSFQTPNAVVDNLMQKLTGEETKVLLFMIRHIYGFPDTSLTRQKRISLSMFINGYTSKKGYVFGGVGLASSTVRKCLAKLCEYNIIKRCENQEGEDDITEDGQRWELLFEGIKYQEMNARKSEKFKRNWNRIRIARATLAAKNQKDEVCCGTADPCAVGQQGGCAVGQQEVKTKIERSLKDQLKKDAIKTEKQNQNGSSASFPAASVIESIDIMGSSSSSEEEQPAKKQARHPLDLQVKRVLGVYFTTSQREEFSSPLYELAAKSKKMTKAIVPQKVESIDTLWDNEPDFKRFCTQVINDIRAKYGEKMTQDEKYIARNGLWKVLTQPDHHFGWLRWKENNGTHEEPEAPKNLTTAITVTDDDDIQDIDDIFRELSSDG